MFSNSMKEICASVSPCYQASAQPYFRASAQPRHSRVLLAGISLGLIGYFKQIYLITEIR